MIKKAAFRMLSVFLSGLFLLTGVLFAQAPSLAGGEYLWAKGMRGTSNDGGWSVAVDSEGSVYTTGYFQGTVDFDPGEGTCNLTREGCTDVFISKLDSAGEFVWAKRVGGNEYDYGNDIAVDSQDNVYITGSFYDIVDFDPGAGTYFLGSEDDFSDVFVLKLAKDGSFIWAARLVGEYGGSLWDEGWSIVVDSTFNVYITGTYTYGISEEHYASQEAFVAKLNSTGSLLWAKGIGGKIDSAEVEYGYGLAVDSDDSVYVTGFVVSGTLVFHTIYPTGDAGSADISASASRRGGGFPALDEEDDTFDIFVSKLSNNGEFLWTKIMGGTSNDKGQSIAVDASGNVYTTGSFSGTADFNPGAGTYDLTALGALDIFVSKLDTEGGFVWAKRIGWASNDEGLDVVLGPSGNLYTTGSFQGSPDFDPGADTHTLTSAGGLDVFISVLDSNGNYVSAKGMGGTSSDEGWGIALDLSGNIHTAGRFSGTADFNPGAGTANLTSAGIYDVFVSKLSGFGGQDMPIIGVSKTAFNFATVQKGKTTPSDSVLISNLGTGILKWTATSSEAWLVPAPKTGTAGKTMKIKVVKASSLAVGTYTGTITIADSNATNSPVTITVTLVVKAIGTDAVPFGEFDIPANGATINTATTTIAGWALDDVGMKSAKVYLQLSATKKKLVGTAKFIVGARPDIEIAYPTYPQNNRAGWSYTLAMKKLPNKGVGTFVLLAYVKDLAGHEVLLGTHTITGVAPTGGAGVPFGSLDTPEDSGTASGSAYLVSGWALTPPPNRIAIEGLIAWVDGMAIGHPSYGAYREDVATEYPGHANADRAGGSFVLDTTKYAEGWHTIAWSATDSSDATREIGSRYFRVQNEVDGTNLNEAAAVEEDASPVIGNAQLAMRPISEIASIPGDGMMPIFVKRGFMDEQTVEAIYPEADGSVRIQIPQASRLAIYLNRNHSFETEAERMIRAERVLEETKNPMKSGRYLAYTLIGEELRLLPIGTSFDSRDGILFWQPGPGFLGEHKFILIDSVSMTRKTISITIIPD